MESLIQVTLFLTKADCPQTDEAFLTAGPLRSSNDFEGMRGYFLFYFKIVERYIRLGKASDL